MSTKRPFRSKKDWWLPYREKIFFLVCLCLLFILSPQKQTQGVVIALSDFYPSEHTALPIPTPAPYPVNTKNTNIPESISAQAISIIDVASGVTMFQKNETTPMPPASTTKIMTALVALDLFNLSEIVTVPEATIEGQLMDLQAGERMTVENLLYGMLVYSGNDAAWALASHHPEGVGAFVALMNQKAKTLNLDQTSYSDPIGLDDPLQRMSSRDLARLSRYAMGNPVIAKMVAIPQITVSNADYTNFYDLKNVNQLLGKVPGVAGIKTGRTQEAGENLVTLVNRGGHQVIIVTLHCEDRFSDATKLIDWVFSNYQWVKYGT